MEQKQFDKLDQLADAVYDKFEELYKAGYLKELKSKLEELCSSLAEKYSVSINMDLDIFDSEKEKSISMVRTGIACSRGEKKPFRVDSSATVHTYITDGAIKKVPHDYCPSCWGSWDFKLMHAKCPECGAEMGKNVFLLLDTDVCPNCEEGKVSRSKPKCTKCNEIVSPDMVRWG